MIELNCETDFVARNDEFRQLAKDLAAPHPGRQPAVCPPRRRARPTHSTNRSGSTSRRRRTSPSNIREKIAEGKLNAWCGESRPDRPEVRQGRNQDDPRVIQEVNARTGENITVARFARFVVGEARTARGRGATWMTARYPPADREVRTPTDSTRIAPWTQPFGRPAVFRRVLLKLSGESFCRPGEGGISVEEVSRIARQAVARRRQQASSSRSSSAAATSSAAPAHPRLRRDQGGDGPLHGHDGDRDQRPGASGRPGDVGCETRLLTTIRMDEVAEPFIRRRASRHLDAAAWSSWPPGPAARSSPPTPPPPCAARSWASRCCSRPPASTASTPPTPRRTPTPSATST